MLKRSGGAGAPPKPTAARKGPTLEGFVDACDFVGAATLLELELRAAEAPGGPARTLAWLGWAAFHRGDSPTGDSRMYVASYVA